VSFRTGVGQFQHQRPVAVPIAGMQFQWLAGIKTEVVDISTSAGTGPGLHALLGGFGNRFAVMQGK